MPILIIFFRWPREVASPTGGPQAAYAMGWDDESPKHCNPLKSEPYGSGLSGISSHRLGSAQQMKHHAEIPEEYLVIVQAAFNH